MEATDSRNDGSALGRMFNVLAAPSEVFTEIKERPVAHSNWIIPAVVWSIVGMALVFLLFSQDWALYEIRAAQRKGMEQSFQKQVAKGKMTQSQADQAMKGAEQFMDKFGPIAMKVGGAVGTMAYAFGTPFFWGLIIWLVGVKILKGDFEYMKAVEAAGLAVVVYLLAGIIGTLLSFVMGKLTYLSLAFFLKEVDWTNKSHLAMAAVNPLYIWFALVIASATAVLSGASWGKAAAWILGLWILSRTLFIAIGMGQFLM